MKDGVYLLSIIEAFVSIWAIKEVVLFTKTKVWYIFNIVQIMSIIYLMYLILMGDDVTPVPRRFYFHVMCIVGLMISKIWASKYRRILEEHE